MISMKSVRDPLGISKLRPPLAATAGWAGVVAGCVAGVVAGGVAGAEAGEGDLVLEFLGGGVERGVHFGGGDFDADQFLAGG